WEDREDAADRAEHAARARHRARRREGQRADAAGHARARGGAQAGTARAGDDAPAAAKQSAGALASPRADELALRPILAATEAGPAAGRPPGRSRRSARAGTRQDPSAPLDSSRGV